MNPDLKELLTRPLLTEALGAGARAAGEFLEGRTQAFGEELDRLAGEVGLDRGARTQGPIQDVMQGLDPTGAVVPERDSPNPLIGLAAGLIGPAMPTKQSVDFLQRFRKMFSRTDPKDFPTFVKGLLPDFEHAVSGTTSEDLLDLGDFTVDATMAADEGSLSRVAADFLDNSVVAEIAARADMGDPVARSYFLETVDPDLLPSETTGYEAILDILEGEAFVDEVFLENTLEQALTDKSTFRALLGID